MKQTAILADFCWSKVIYRSQVKNIDVEWKRRGGERKSNKKVTFDKWMKITG